jgi:hypothetical protein
MRGLNKKFGPGCTLCLQRTAHGLRLSGRTKEGGVLFCKNNGDPENDIHINLPDFETFSEMADLIALTHGLNTQVVDFCRSLIRIEFIKKA